MPQTQPSFRPSACGKTGNTPFLYDITLLLFLGRSHHRRISCLHSRNLGGSLLLPLFAGQTVVIFRMDRMCCLPALAPCSRSVFTLNEASASSLNGDLYHRLTPCCLTGEYPKLCRESAILICLAVC